MELNTLDRIVILGLLPKVGDITTLRISRELESRLGFSEEEHKRLKIEVNKRDGNIYWDSDADAPINIDLGDVATRIIKDALLEMNERRQLTRDHLSLYERFVEQPKVSKVLELAAAR